MPSVFKYITDDKISTIQNKLYESVPITGTYVSGTYNDANVKNYTHDRFQSVFDYPYLSSSANPIFDISVGYSNQSSMSSSANTLNKEKILNYTQFAQNFNGFDATGTILRFDEDGDFSGGTKLNECIFVMFSRLLVKDGIKKGSFSATFLTGNTWAAPHGREEINDLHATSSYFVNSPVGEWSYLSGSTKGKVGAIFYGPGLIVLTASIFTSTADSTQQPIFFSNSLAQAQTVNDCLTGSAISSSANGLRRRWVNCNFVNTTELNSQMIFVDIGSNEFNYSSNPTYLSGSKIVVKTDPTDIPITYITEVGLYSGDSELLAVAKLSEPIKNQAGSALSLRIRQDF